MTTYSDAANAYAISRGHDHSNWERGGCTIAAAYDAALATVFAEPAPEPVRLDPDDPRWRDGARVRGVFADGSSIDGLLGRVSGVWYIAYGDGLRSVEIESRHITVYLLAEAPDPDAELVAKVEAAVIVSEGDREPGVTRTQALIAALRANGVLA